MTDPLLQGSDVSRTVSRLPAEGESLATHGNATADYKINAETGCWEWAKRSNHKGYGVGSFESVGIDTKWAHRAYWIAANGPIPAGRHVVIDHLCRNPICVNPKHLEAVEQATNIHRGAGAKLTMEIAREVRRMVIAGHSTKEITRVTGVTTQNVWWIAEDKAWREDPTAPRQPVWPKRDCVSCGKPVVGRMRTAIYCSDECRISSKNTRRYAA